MFCPRKEFGKHVMLAFVFWCCQSFSSYRDLPFCFEQLDSETAVSCRYWYDILSEVVVFSNETIEIFVVR